MDIIYYEDINARDEIEKKYNIRAFINTYSSFDRISEVIEESISFGTLISPSPFSAEMGKCVGSYMDTYNFLKFRDGQEFYYIVQNRFYCSAVWIPSSDILVFFAERKIIDDVKVKLFDVENKLSSREVPLPFEGIINAKGRPYHYFYSKAPAIFAYGTKVSNLKVADAIDTAFIPGEFFCRNEESAKSFKSFNAVEASFVFPGWALGTDKSEIRKWQDSLNVALVDDVKRIGPPLDPTPKIWIGLAGEKRKNNRLDESILNFLLQATSMYPGLEIYFDGLTRPFHVKADDFYSRCQNEVAVIDRIIYELENTNVSFKYQKLVGATAKEKIAAALDVNYFISYALTDSMWCSVFGQIPGICWYGGKLKKVTDEHIHIYTHFIPEGNEYTFSKDSKYSLEEFFFNPIAMGEALFKGLDIAMHNPKTEFLSLMQTAI